MIPPITHLQFLHLDVLGDRELKVSEFIPELTEEMPDGHRHNTYRILAKLEEKRLVRSQHLRVLPQNQRMIFYRRTKVGREACERTIAFYRARANGGEK